MFSKFISWLVQSSEDPSQLSLTIKGIVIAVIPWVVTILGLFHITVQSADVANIGNSIVTLIQATLTAIGAGIAVYGLVRKFINTYFIPWPTGSNTNQG